MSIEKALFKYDGREKEFTVDEIEHTEEFDFKKRTFIVLFQVVKLKLNMFQKGNTGRILKHGQSKITPKIAKISLNGKKS